MSLQEEFQVIPKVVFTSSSCRPVIRCVPLLVVVGCAAVSGFGADKTSASIRTLERSDRVQAFFGEFCIECHNAEDQTAGFSLESSDSANSSRDAELWEKIARRLRSRQMPPMDARRPTEATYHSVTSVIEKELDAAAIVHPNPGRTNTFRRLTRTEYGNAIRHLLGLELDVTTLLPKDQASHGFDNITVGDLSPTLLNRYISAAQKISRLAVGSSITSPGGDTFRIRPDLTQEEHVVGLPIGTRGGMLIPYSFPQNGEYEIQIRLMRDRNEHVEGLKRSHQLEILVDRQRVGLFTVRRPQNDTEHQTADAHLHLRVPVTAGTHDVGVTFLKQPSSLVETKRQPFQAHFNFHRHPRLSPAVYQVSITGPFNPDRTSETASRRLIFVCKPDSEGQETACATQILSQLMRRAYRRPVTDADLQQPMQFYQEARNSGDFDAGIESALAAILVNPQFLFRIERDPPDMEPGSVYQISDIDLASRLSFFLWSSIPDNELLDLAEARQLHLPSVLKQQVQRMLADERSESLSRYFAGQWLYLRNLESLTPDLRLFPDFDHNLREAFRTETELFFDSIVRKDRSVLDLIRADYTFLNERLASHYGIPHIYGSRFRRVVLDPGSRRGGLLRHGSLLTVTSYATRTSPVIRGHWILKNLLGSPPPPPPDNVPDLKDNTVATNLTVRERLSEHRANPACATCHNLMDPVGFSLENYDAVGRWRDLESGIPIDASGGLPDGRKFSGADGLEEGLLDRPELFVGTLCEKLLTFGLGRGVDYSDAPAIRSMLRQAAADDYRFSSIILAIVQSAPFQMRRTE